MELNNFGRGVRGRSEQLLLGGARAENVESGPRGAFKVEVKGRFESALTAVGAMGAFVLCVALLYLLAQEWQQETNYRD